MTTLTKLGIQGIRSFSSERMESLEFEKPVTLIVGHNGAGKTTVIECLKMSTCGQLPPNCDKGHGFVHDPNVAGVPEVKGQIRLLFRTGVSHQHVCATRTFQLTNTRSKTGVRCQFKALENLLRIKDRNGGDDNSSSRRCVDMDAAIPNLMGVSRAILEHVIFCHQEDSNWPLGERILLKKRFDEIFGSSRYTKALEAIEKRRKETAKEGKDKSHVLELVKKDLDVSILLCEEEEKVKISLLEIDSKISNLNIQIDSLELDQVFLQKKELESREGLILFGELTKEIGTSLEPIQSLDSLESALILNQSNNADLGQKLESALQRRNELSIELSKCRNNNSHVLLSSKISDLNIILNEMKISDKFDIPYLEELLQRKLEERSKAEQEQLGLIKAKEIEINDLNMCLNEFFLKKKEISKLELSLQQLNFGDIDIEETLKMVDQQIGLSGGTILRNIVLFFEKKKFERSNFVDKFNELLEQQKLSDSELWTARSALKMYTQMKNKSVQDSKCQFCRQTISDIEIFGTLIDRMTKKLPEIVAELTASSKNVLDDLLETKFELGRIEGYSDVLARIPPEGGDLKELIEKKSRLEQAVSLNQQLDAIRKDDNDLLNRKIVDLETKLQNNKEELQQIHLSSKLGELDLEISTMRSNFHQIFLISTQIDQLKLDISSTENVPNNMESYATLEAEEMEVSLNITLFLKEQKLLENDREKLFLNIRVKKLFDKKNSLSLNSDITELPEKLKICFDQIKQLRDVRASLTGQATQLRLQLGEISRKQKNFVNIRERYRQSMIQAETTNLVLRDIARYHQALDRALMAYHVGKMNEINSVVRQLWQRVYRGTDIDYIAIRSDGETDETSSRSYNYRVVMVKNEVELEMRGRCSAGQKVLASLIIRLSLSESFCLNCGILALDEPTTNLDRSNITGLAEALAELIESRRCQQNFQLIIITHDEAFVRMLGRLQACENFYRVAKDEYGHSTISRSAIYELNA